FWLTILLVFSLLSATEGVQAVLKQVASIPAPASLALLGGLIVCPFLFLLVLMLGLLGAALAGVVPPRSEEAGGTRGAGVRAWWLAALLAYLIGALARYSLAGGLADTLALAAALGVPAVTLRLARLARRPGSDPQQLAMRVVNWLSRRLVWRRIRGGRRRTLD